MSEEELKQKYYQYQLLEQRMQEVQKQLHTTANQAFEVEYIKNSLDEISMVKEGREILCPLSNGIFVRAVIKDPGSFFMNVGSNVVVKKDLKDAKVLMDTQGKDIEEARGLLLEQMEMMTLKMKDLEKDLAELTKD